MEILYCSFMNIFGIVDADSLVRDDPLYPFMVYGIGVLVCAIALVPLRIQLAKRRKTMWGAALEYFVITVPVHGYGACHGLSAQPARCRGQLPAVGQLATAWQHFRARRGS